MNTLPHYFYFLLALAFFLQGGACFFAVAGLNKKIFVPFSIYSFFIGCAFMAGLFAEIPEVAFVFGRIRFFSQFLALFFLAESSLSFFEIRRSIKLFCFLLLAVAGILPHYCGYDLLQAEMLSLYILSFCALPVSAVVFWKLGNVYKRFEAAFKITSVFHLGNGVAILSFYYLIWKHLPLELSSDHEIGMILILFSFLCTFFCSVCFLLFLKNIEIANGKIRIATYILTPAMFLLFALLGVAVPCAFRIAGEYISFVRVENNAELLQKDLVVSLDRVVLYARDLAENKTVHEILRNNRLNKSILDETFEVEKFVSSKLQIVVYLLNSKGICVDASNKSAPQYSMIGQDASFTEYFKQAMQNGISKTFAPENITGLPCIYAAIRVNDTNGRPLGVVVARRNIAFALDKFSNSYAAIIAPENTVFFTNTDRISSKLVKWESGTRWFCMQGELYQEKYSNGIIFAELPCTYLSVPGWRLVLGVKTLMPFFMYLCGQFFLLLLWILTLCMISIYIIQLKMRIQLSMHNSWRNTVFNNNTAGIIVADMNRNIIDANETVTKMLGYSTDELKKLGIELIYPTGSAGRAFLETVSQTFSEGKTYENLNLSLRKKNGTQAVFRIAGSSFSKHPSESVGFPVKGIVWTITDQTKELLEISRLKENEEMFRGIVESSAEHIFMLDSHGFFIYSNNKQIRSIIKENKAPLHLNEIYDSVTTGLYMKMLENVFTVGHPLSFQHTLKTPGGKILIMANLFPIRKEGIIYAVGGIARDITTFRVQETSLN